MGSSLVIRCDEKFIFRLTNEDVASLTDQQVKILSDNLAPSHRSFFLGRLSWEQIKTYVQNFGMLDGRTLDRKLSILEDYFSKFKGKGLFALLSEKQLREGDEFFGKNAMERLKRFAE